MDPKNYDHQYVSVSQFQNSIRDIFDKFKFATTVCVRLNCFITSSVFQLVPLLFNANYSDLFQETRQLDCQLSTTLFQVNFLFHHINIKAQLQNIKVDNTKMKIHHEKIKIHIVNTYPSVLWPIILQMTIHRKLTNNMYCSFWRQWWELGVPAAYVVY